MLTYLLGGLALVALIIPGIWLFVSWTVAVPALLTEDVRGLKALRRSFQLVRGMWWRTFAIFLLGYILAGILSSIVSGVVVGIAFAADSPVAEFAVTALANILGALVSTPFTAAFVTVLYVDLRVRKEGFDLQLLFERLGGAPGGGVPFSCPRRRRGGDAVGGGRPAAVLASAAGLEAARRTANEVRRRRRGGARPRRVLPPPARGRDVPAPRCPRSRAAGRRRRRARAAAGGRLGRRRPVHLAPPLAGVDAKSSRNGSGARVGGVAAPGRLATATREEARAILDQRRFHGSDVPRPLAGVLGWIGDSSARSPAARPPARWRAGRTGRLWTSLAALVLAARLAGRAPLDARGGIGGAALGPARGRGGNEPVPGARADADAAERSGDLARALRLRFRAGLLRLARAPA